MHTRGCTWLQDRCVNASMPNTCHPSLKSTATMLNRTHHHTDTPLQSPYFLFISSPSKSTKGTPKDSGQALVCSSKHTWLARVSGMKPSTRSTASPCDPTHRKHKMGKSKKGGTRLLSHPKHLQNRGLSQTNANSFSAKCLSGVPEKSFGLHS